MTRDNATIRQRLEGENQALRARLEEAEQIIRAIRHDEVDALLVSGPSGDRVHIIESAERPYRLLVENATDYAIFTLDREGCFSSWNVGAQRMLGYSESEILGEPGAITFTPEDLAHGIPEQELRAALDEGRADADRWYVRKDGTRFYASGVTMSFYNGHGAFLGFAKIMRDLSERLRAEEERAALVHDAAVLAERNRIAQELHDTLAQGLTGIKLQMDLAEDAVEDEPDIARAHIVRVREIAQQSLTEVRRVVEALRARPFEEPTLAHALQRLVEETPGSVQLSFAVSGRAHALPAELESHLYRIGQEAITNSLRHADAQHIRLELSFTDNQVHLLVMDDGRGFDPTKVADGFGLIGMQERARRCGADHSVTSRPGQGTQVVVIANVVAE